MEDARIRSPFARTLRVLTRCDGTAALVERYARDVSHAGVFLRTREQLEIGAPVRFEYLLSDGRCALAGEGFIAFCRAEAQVGAPRAGVGISIAKLRHGDRAVIERMTAARGAALSRFERPEGITSVPPSNPPPSSPPLQAAALFADVKTAGAGAPDAAAAYLSADLTNDLPTVRPPPSGPAPRHGSEPPRSVGELADQLEPPPERPSELEAGSRDADVTLDAMPLERDVPPPSVPGAVPGAVRGSSHPPVAAAPRVESTAAGAKVSPTPARSDDRPAPGNAPRLPRSRLLPWLVLVALLVLAAFYVLVLQRAERTSARDQGAGAAPGAGLAAAPALRSSWRV